MDDEPKEDYALRLLNITKVNPEEDGFRSLKPRSGHRIVADESHVYCFGGYNPNIILNYDELSSNDWFQPSPLFNELWKFNIALKTWSKVETSGESPNELASNCAILLNNHLYIFGGTGVPFGLSSSNKLSICNLKTLEWKLVGSSGQIPEERYGQAMLAHDNKLYVVGGTSGFEYSIAVHSLNCATKEWQEFKVLEKPEERYRHEIAIFENCIYVFGGGTATSVFGFNKVPVFNLKSCSWTSQCFHPDPSTPRGFPSARRCHGLVQVQSEVYIIGGFDGRFIFPDIWKADLKSKTWLKLHVELPLPVYFHSIALNPAGKLFVFGGVTNINDEIRTNEMYEMWLKIPKLKESCWEAILKYIPNIANHSKDHLLEIGIPSNFVKRLDDFVRPRPTPA